ncbi:MAG: alpha/beta fold hydrolase [Pseudomonadota bacterium]
MARRLKWIGSGILGLLVLAGIALAWSFTPDTAPQAMIEKYGGASARWAAGEAGQKLHYRDQGKADGPALVLVHGSNASLQTWEPWVGLLGADYRLISLDLPGHGLSGPHPKDDYSARAMVAAVEAVATAARLDRFIIAGNSMGGWVAWRYALAHPDQVAALILIDAAGVRAGEGAGRRLPIGFRLAMTPGVRVIFSKLTPRGLIARSLRQSVENQAIIDDAMVDRYWELLRFPGNRRATILRFAADREQAMEAQLGAITAPTLILWGEKDRLIPVAAADVFHTRIAGSRLIIYPGVGHLPMEEAAAASAADVKDFLQRMKVAP